MQSASHAHTTSTATAAEASSPSPTGISPQRRVMRAAWALHRDSGGTFATSLKTAWMHEKTQAGLSAVNTLRGQIVEAAYFRAAGGDLALAMPIENYRLSLKASRNLLVDLIDRLVNVLDFIDGDPDIEHDNCDFEYDNRDLPQIFGAEQRGGMHLSQSSV